MSKQCKKLTKKDKDIIFFPVKAEIPYFSNIKVFGNNQKRETSCISEVTFLLSCFCNDIQYFPRVCTHQTSSEKNSNFFFRRKIRCSD